MVDKLCQLQTCLVGQQIFLNFQFAVLNMQNFTQLVFPMLPQKSMCVGCSRGYTEMFQRLYRVVPEAILLLNAYLVVYAMVQTMNLDLPLGYDQAKKKEYAQSGQKKIPAVAFHLFLLIVFFRANI